MIFICGFFIGFFVGMIFVAEMPICLRLSRDVDSGALWLGFYRRRRCLKLWPVNSIARLERRQAEARGFVRPFWFGGGAQ